MGLDLGKLSFTIDVQTGQFGQKMGEVEARAEKAGKTLEDTGRSAVAAGRQIGSTGDDVRKASTALVTVGDGAEKAGKRLETTGRAAQTTGRSISIVGDDARKAGTGLAAVSDSAEKAGRGLDKAAGSAKNAGDAVGRAAESARQTSQSLKSAGDEAERAGSQWGKVAALVSGAAILGAGKTIIDQGNDFTNSMNTMAAVSQATDAQLAAVSDRARQLGTDISLPSTSASDAALAMSELAKGGFSVEQSMDAAKGTLQLAAAAQIDAAKAATIQSQAIQAFGLSADDAARVSDILAGAANASSAEMTDVAYALQASGTVAKAFGVSIDDTATALAMFANAGITGSDAGTLLKTAMLALTDQGKPAQKAIRELGLEIYDSEGKFVGLSSLMGQLNEAAGEMTDEQYQAAAATLFGSDAMRLASIAAEQGSENFDQLKEAVTRQGQAAEVAEAKTRGLPGAISAVGNSMEEVSMLVYDAFDDQLTGALHGVAEGIGNLGAAATTVPVEAWAAGFALLAGNMTGAFRLMDAGSGRMAELGREMTAARLAAAEQGRSIGRLAAGMEVLGRHSPTIKALNEAYARGASPLATLAARHIDAAQAAKVQVMASKNLFDTVDRMGSQASHSFVAGVSRMGAAASGAMSGGISLLKSGVSGLVGALGGPWGLAITGATALLAHFASEHAKAAEAEAQHKAQVDALTDSLDRQSGAFTEATRSAVINQAEKDGVLAKSAIAGVDSADVVNAMLGEADALRLIKNRADEATQSLFNRTEANKNYVQTYESMGISVDTLTAALGGNKDAIDKVLQGVPQLDSQFHALKGSMTETEKAALEVAEATRATNHNLDEATAAAERKAAADDRLSRIAGSTASAMKLVGDAVVGIVDEKTISVKADSITDDTRAKLEELHVKVNQPYNGKVTLEFPDGVAIKQVLDEMGIKLETLPDGKISIDASSVEKIQPLMEGISNWLDEPKQGEPLTLASNIPEVEQRLIDLGILVRKGANGQVSISDNFDAALRKIDRVNAQNGRTTRQTHEMIEVRRTYWESIGRPANTVGPVPLPRHAAGGVHDGYRLPTSGPGTQVTDGFLALTSGGVPTAWLDAGEQVVRRDRTERFSHTLWAINDGDGTAASVIAALFRDLPRFEDGGVSGEIKSQLSQIGPRYVFGGWSTAGTDCSGAVSAAVNIAEGDPMFASRMTTMTAAGWLQARGYEPGTGGPGALNIGISHGGPGGGHTAAQLPDGTFIESGGNTGQGMTIGGKAGPLTGRGFTEFWHKKYNSGEDLANGNIGNAAPSSMKGGFGGVAATGTFNPISLSGSGAGARMGVTGSVGKLAKTIGVADTLNSLAQEHGLAQELADAYDVQLDKFGELLFITDKTIESFNELGQARQEEAEAAREILEINERISDLKKSMAKEDRDNAERIMDAEKNLAKARAEKVKTAEQKANKADKIAKAKRAVRDAKEGKSEKSERAVKQLIDLEEQLVKAREKQVHAAAKIKDAQVAHMIEMLSAPAHQIIKALGFIGDIMDIAASAINRAANREQKRLEQANKAVEVWERQISAQNALTQAMEASNRAMQEQVTARWRSDLAVQDAEWQLTLHRKKSMKELAEAGLFATDVQEKQAAAARRTAVLQAQIDFEKARRDQQNFERDLALALSNEELAFQQSQAGLHTRRLALVSAVLVDIQSKLNDERLRELEAKRAQAEAAAGKTRGALGIVGALVGIAGAVGLGMSGNIPGALALGAGAISGLVKGAGDIADASAKGDEAASLRDVLNEAKNGAPKAGGALGDSLKKLEDEARIAELRHREAMDERKRSALERQKLLAQLVDKAEKSLELAKREEQRANDLESLESTNTQAQVFMQFGGSTWGGRFQDGIDTVHTGFGGIRHGNLGPVGSLQVEGVERSRATVGRAPAPSISGAAAAVSTARSTAAIRAHMVRVADSVDRILDVVRHTDRRPHGATVGTVINGNVQVGGDNYRQLADALAAKG